MRGDREQIAIALHNVKIIKDIMQKSKFQLSMLAGLFLWYGALRFSELIISMVGNYYAALYSPATQGTQFTLLFRVLNYLIFAGLFVIFLKKRRVVSASQNEYTLSLFDVWGFILFLFPFVKYIISDVYWAFSFYEMDLTALVEKDFSALTYGSMMLGLLVTGILLRNRVMRTASILLMLFYPFIPILLARAAFGEVLSRSTQSDSLPILIIHRNIGYLLEIITVIVMGIYFKKQTGGFGNGDQ